MLLAHINALLRRDRSSSEMVSDSSDATVDILLIQDLVINQKAYTLHKDRNVIILTSREFQLLAILASNAGKPINRDSLYQQLRGIEYDGLDRSLDLRISSLRKKLGDDVPPCRYIKTVRGQGYLLVG